VQLSKQEKILPWEVFVFYSDKERRYVETHIMGTKKSAEVIVISNDEGLNLRKSIVTSKT
jgi:hypothetical protein